MMLKTVTVNCLDFNDVVKNAKLILKLRELTIFPYSGMNYELTELTKLSKKRKVNCRILTASHNNQIIGWAIMSKESSNYSFKGNYFRTGDGILFQVYIKPEFRRQGVGSRLIKTARRKSYGTRLCIAPWDYGSRRFFDKFENFNSKVL